MTAVAVANPTTALQRGLSEFPGLIGRQEPEWSLRSEGYDFAHGLECVGGFEWAAKVRLFPWQVNEIMQASACDEVGRWTHKDVAVVCPRQNGKSFLVEAILLYRLFALGHQIVFTAQRWSTAQSIRNRLWRRIKGNKKLTNKIVRNVNSQGSAEIELESGAKVQFSTRSGDAGRGFDKIDLVVFDEAYNLDDADIDALLPIQLKADDPQTIYLSTPVNSDHQSFGVKLSSLRSMVRDKAPGGWAWSEYAAPDGADRDLAETWALANPSLREGPEVEAIRKLHGPMSETSFDVEILGRGRWFEPERDSDELDLVISLNDWEDLIETSPVRDGHFVLAIDAVPAERNQPPSVASIVQGVKTATGVHAQLIYHGPFDEKEIVSRVKGILARDTPAAVLIDRNSAAYGLAMPLKNAGVEVTDMTFPLVKEACQNFLLKVSERAVTHDDDPRLVEALKVAQLKTFSDGRYVWEQFSGEISQLVALTHATWGVSAFKPQVVDAAPLKSVPASAVGSSWQSMSF